MNDNTRPTLFVTDTGVIALAEVASVECRHVDGYAWCHIVLRSGVEIRTDARYSRGLTQAVKAHHAGPPVIQVLLLSDQDRKLAEAGVIVPIDTGLLS